jgi:hypothetical protein
MDPKLYVAVAGRLDDRRCRHRRVDQGDCRPALQGGQHGRRCRDRGADQCVEGREFPFVFGGDGASFAVAPLIWRSRARRWRQPHLGEEDLDLTMRVALVPVSAIRAQGLDVRVARFGPSTNLSYAMFTGGGLGWAMPR